MPDANLVFSIQSLTATELKIKVTNDSGITLDTGLSIELFPPASLLDNRILTKSREAAEPGHKPPGLSSLAGVVSGPPSWSVFVKGDTSEAGVPIMLRNDRKDDGKPLRPPIPVANGEVLNISIPLDEKAGRDSVLFPYEYAYNEKRSRGELKWESVTPGWVPDVTLKSNQPNPTMIPPRTAVRISWAIKDGISATLRGPLPGGNAAWTLSNSDTGDFNLSEGEFNIYAVGPVSYLLQAQVKGPPGKETVEVVRVLSLDVKSADKFAYLRVRPDRVLPFGPMEFEWAAWGVDSIQIFNEGQSHTPIELTDMTLSNTRQGIGTIHSNAGTAGPGQEMTVREVILKALIGGTNESVKQSYSVISWRQMQPSTFTGKPVGLAVAGEDMMLLTTDGPWIAKVGPNDSRPTDYNSVMRVPFSRPPASTPPDSAKAWRAVAALDDTKFVVLRETNESVLQVARYNTNGTRDGAPIDISHDIRSMIESGGNTFDFAVHGNRVYVVVEPASGGPRRAFSVSFTSTPPIRDETLLEQFHGYRLLTFDNALYALNRESGRVFRFTVNPNGSLEPYEAASAVSKGSSMLTKGVFVPVGRVLAVLDPSSVPSQTPRAKLSLNKTIGPLKAVEPGLQDLVYNPQANSWAPCGKAKKMESGVVCGFRGGTSPRLWMIEPKSDGGNNTYTLTVGSEGLYSPNFAPNLSTPELEKPYLDATREFTIVNTTGMQFLPLNSLCFRVGLSAFSATTPADISSPVGFLPPVEEGGQAKFQIRYNKKDPPVVTLRLRMQRPSGTNLEYFLEVTLSGPDLANATTVMKRIAANGTIAEVPESRQQSSSDRIVFFPSPLAHGIKLRISNRTPYRLWLRSPYATEERDREKEYTSGQEILINHKTPAFSVYAHGAGELPFNVDFALPHGIEVTNQLQKNRIRVDTSKSQELRVDEVWFSRQNGYTHYQCSVRCKKEQIFTGVFIGDGALTNDGALLYLPLTRGVSDNRAEVLKVDANTLVDSKRFSTEYDGIFAVPNALAVSADCVFTLLKSNRGQVFEHDLRVKTTFVTDWHVVTNFKASRNEAKFFELGMKQVSTNPPRYSYSYEKHNLATYDPEQVIGLDHLNGFRSARVPGAPGWVSPDTISPMDVSGNKLGICIDGGLISVDLQTGHSTEIRIGDTGREEAVFVDPPYIFCAHSREGSGWLMISRIDRPENNQTVTLNERVVDMVTDANPPAGPHLRYNRPRAVSLAVIDDLLFYSCGPKISVLDKQDLRSSRGEIPVGLPCRIIHVRRWTPPGADQRYGTPKNCYQVWAIGATGDGRTPGNCQITLYKFAFAK